MYPQIFWMQEVNIELLKTRYLPLALFLFASLSDTGLGEIRSWLGWQDSNLRVTGSKPAALPLGYTPKRSLFLSKGPAKLKPKFEKMGKR